MPKRKRNDDGTYSAGYRRGSYPYAVAAKYRKRAVGRAGPRGSASSKAYWGDTWDAADEAQRERRALMHYRGDGDYRRALKWGSRGLGAAAGGLLGGFGSKSYTGALKGAQTGYDVGAGFSKYMGWGAYGGPSSVGQNQLIAYDPSQKQITVNHDHNSGDIIFQHTEFIQNVVVDLPAVGGVDPPSETTSSFNVQSFALNPGLEGTFPFLAQIAANFTMYEFQGLVMQYKPTSGEGASASNALGKVILATDYDPSATPFTNTQAMENYDYAASTKPSSGMHHGVETALSQRLTNQLYVRTEASAPGPSPQGQKDKVLTDLGLFQIATEGITGPNGSRLIIGELWVTYKVKLSRASLRVNQGLDLANFDRFIVTQGAGATMVPTLQLSTNSIGGLCTNLDNAGALYPDGIRYAFPRTVVAGTYLCRLSWTAQAIGGMAKEWNHVYVRNGSLMPMKDDQLLQPRVGSGCENDPGATPVWDYATWIAEGFPRPSDQYVDPSWVPTGSSGGRMIMEFCIQVLAHDSDQAMLSIHMDGTAWSLAAAAVFEVTQVNDDFVKHGSSFVPI